ncbi:MAG: right-handed parallel beta-helix repeat-containing protein [Verrucomicrobiota bacterium]
MFGCAAVVIRKTNDAHCVTSKRGTALPSTFRYGTAISRKKSVHRLFSKPPRSPNDVSCLLALRLDELIAKYQDGYEKSILSDFSTEITTLNDGYLKALKRAEENFANSGDLDKVLVVRQTLEAASGADNTPIPFPDPNPDAPQRLNTLRTAYDGKLAELAASHDARVARLLPAFDNELDALQREFTQQEKIEEALQIKNARSTFQSDGLPFGQLDLPTAKPTTVAVTTTNNEPTTTPTNDTPATFAKNIPPDALRVTPDGAGDTLTLDEALAQATRGQTIALASGEYPPSATAMEKYNSNAYHVETEGLTLIGNRALLPNLTIRTDDVTLQNLGFTNLAVYDWRKEAGDETRHSKNTTVENCRFSYLDAAGTEELTVSNSIGSIKVNYYSDLALDHCTLIGHPSDYFLGQQIMPSSTSRIENSILSGSAYAVQVAGVTEEATIRKCLIHGTRGLVGREGPPAIPGDPPSVINIDPREANREYNLRLSNCIEQQDPQFINPGDGDYRLGPDSPARSQASDGRDLGAQLTADGWPISP